MDSATFLNMINLLSTVYFSRGKGLQDFSKKVISWSSIMASHGDQIFMIASETFYNFSNNLTNHKYLVTLR